MFKKILVPLDGSELAEQALATAAAMATVAGGKLLLLRSVYLINTSLPALAYEYEWNWPEYSREEVRSEARHYLENVVHKLELPKVPMEIFVSEEDAAGAIVDTAVAEDVDLIVMSTHGWSGIKRWIMGSVTERVLQSAPCPVLVARRSGPLRHILITLDGSELAERALDPAVALARQLDARVTLLRVNDMPLVESPVESPLWRRSLLPREMVAAGHQQAEGYLRTIRRQCGEGLNKPVQITVVDGHTVECILDQAVAQDVDLIAMSTHGRTGLRRWQYGSVTAKVMQGAHCSLLVVRTPREVLA